MSSRSKYMDAIIEVAKYVDLPKINLGISESGPSAGIIMGKPSYRFVFHCEHG